MMLTRIRRVWVGLAALVLGVVAMAPMLAAQQAQGQGQPARAVRLSYVDGQVTLAQNGQVLAEQAVANTPLFEGMQLTTADNGKAEIQFEDGSIARLSPDSSLTLAVLRGAGESAEADLLLNSGLAYFELQGGGLAGKMSVKFGGASVVTSGFTVIRATLDSPPGELAVFTGNAHLEIADGGSSGAASVDLHGGESIALGGAGSLAESVPPDSWDSWNSDRDQALTAEAAAQTGASANVGANESPEWNDLDANGNWYDVPGQGYVWSPEEAAGAGFDPYGNGNWMWTPGYGYLWVSGYSWGYLPYQCGLWNFYDGFGWGWAPGMGGCMPWWGMGYYGGMNIGQAPRGYQPIPRPILPRRPIGMKPVPMVAVNRGGPNMHFTAPVRDRNTPVTIAGNTVLPLRPLPARQVSNQGFYATGSSRPQPGGQGTQPGRGQITVVRPGYSSAHPTTTAPAYGPGWQSEPAANPNPVQPNRGVSGGGAANQPSSQGFTNRGLNPGSGSTGASPASRSSSGSASHSSSGGSGSSGGSHSSGGSSGGGGGGSHSSGGGGGGGGGGSHGGGGSSGGGGGGHH